MSALGGFTRRLRALFRKRATERELDEEIRLHVELETEANIRRGMSPADARRRALVAFGGIEAVKEAHRDARGTRLLEDALADVRHAFRVLRRNPLLNGAAILTLALGVGANTAIFSAVDAVILRPLPFAHAGRLVALGENNPDWSWHMQVAAPANMLDWKELVAAFEDVGGWADWGMGTQTLTGSGEPRPVNVALVTGNFFDVLGVEAERGRVLRDAETWSQAGAPAVGVISHRMWRDVFGSAPDAVGRSIRLDGQDIQVVGVMPERFRFPYETGDVWLPVSWRPERRAQPSFRRAHWMRPIARLKPGASLEGADAQLQAVVRRLQRDHPQLNRHMGAAMVPLQRFLVGDTRRPLLILLAAAVLLLLIACANVANLLMVQATGREREAALRLTLGAGRGRLVRQALTESVVLSLLGGAAGLALGWWGTRALGALQPRGMLPVAAVAMNWTVLLYVLAIATAAGLLFGTAPALWSARRAPAEALKDDSRGSVGQRLRGWSDALAVGEMAIAILLTLGAGLLVRSYQRLQETSPGFDPHGVLAVDLNVPDSRYGTGERVQAFYNDVMARIRALPSVQGVATTSRAPLRGVGWSSDFSIAGREIPKEGSEVAHSEVSPEYFRAMRVPLVEGRLFTDADGPNSPPVVIINEALANRYFTDQDPIGQRICFDRTPDSTSVWRTIVGVVGSERQRSLALEPMMEFYDPHAQDGSRSGMTVMIRTGGDPLALLPSVRAAIAQVDPEMAIRWARSMDDIRAESVAKQRFFMTLLLAFAATGFLLSVIGVYGVMAHLARRRTHEMGIRLALGARAGSVRWLVVRHALLLVAAAVVIGVGLGAGATRAMRSLLYEVSPGDPLTFAAIPLLLALTALAASWIPALKASRADPARALRAQ